MSYNCKILADSLNPKGIRLTTFEVTYQRFIHSELMTHRTFSRNAASSRAIPVTKILERVKLDPAMPVFWGKNQPGMQANEELEGEQLKEAQAAWLWTRDQALLGAQRMLNAGLHKQVTNRVLEPWVWITVLITATDLTNFFNLRRHKDAQPELKYIADLMYQAYTESKPVQLQAGEWHLPLSHDKEELKKEKLSVLKVCTGRAARVSYLTHDGVRNPLADIELHDKLLESGHMSPFEHCARAMRSTKYYGNFKGFKQYRKFIPNEAEFKE
jgi:thymidylate synthase ThyX